MQNLSATDAAERLGVSPRRVRAMIAHGILPAERVGNRYVLDADVVRAAAARKRPGGRPLSARNAWAVLGGLSDREDAVSVSVRSRYRIKHLIDAGGPDLVSALRNAEPRAELERWRVLPGDLVGLRDRADLIPSGLAADDPHIDIRYDLARDGLDVYADPEVLAELERRLQPEKNSLRPNLLVRVPRAASWILREARAPLAVVAGDLLDHEDPRVRRSAQTALREAARR